MPLYVLTVGNDVEIPWEKEKIILGDKKFPWSLPFMSYNMDKLHSENHGKKYISPYERYRLDRNLLEEQFKKAQKINVDYVVFSTDAIVFDICRVLTKKAYENSDFQLNDHKCGGLFVIESYNQNTEKFEFGSYWFDKYGHLDEWPDTKNNPMGPFEILLSELI